MKKIIAIAIIAAIVCLYPIFLIVYGHVDHIRQVDVAVVFGNKVNTDGTLSKRLQARLDEYIVLYNQGYFRKIIVSGA